MLLQAISTNGVQSKVFGFTPRLIVRSRLGIRDDFIECLPLGAETQELQPWEECPALARFSACLHELGG